MAELDDLKTAVNKIITDVSLAVTDIKSLSAQIAASAGDPEQVKALTDQLNVAAASLEAVLPPAETPPPPAPPEVPPAPAPEPAPATSETTKMETTSSETTITPAPGTPETPPAQG